jgi:hypothetical protein
MLLMYRETSKAGAAAAVEFMMAETLVLSILCCLSLFCVYENGIKLQHQFFFYYLLYWHFLACDTIKFFEHNILILMPFLSAVTASSFLSLDFFEFTFNRSMLAIRKWIMHTHTLSCLQFFQ